MELSLTLKAQSGWTRHNLLSGGTLCHFFVLTKQIIHILILLLSSPQYRMCLLVIALCLWNIYPEGSFWCLVCAFHTRFEAFYISRILNCEFLIWLLDPAHLFCSAQFSNCLWGVGRRKFFPPTLTLSVLANKWAVIIKKIPLCPGPEKWLLIIFNLYTQVAAFYGRSIFHMIDG